MRIIYLAKVPVSKGSGVNKKIASQIEAWRKQGNEVLPVFLVREDGVAPELENLGAELVRQKRWFLNYLKSPRLDSIVDDFGPDLIYFRLGNLPAFSTNTIFSCPVVLEINTRIFEELKVTSRGLKKWLLALHYRFLLTKASGYVGVTKECLLGLPNKPAIQVGNSISFDKDIFFRVVKERSRSNVCIFVGSQGWAWHGVDRLIDIARNNPDYQFWIVGYTRESIHAVELPTNVKVFGTVIGERYVELLSSASIAFGSLAMDRNNMFYSSSLKNRDYLQYGLPIIMQGVDSDLEELACVYSLPYQYDVSDVTKALHEVGEISEVSFQEVINSVSSDTVELRRLNFLEKVFHEHQSYRLSNVD